MQLSRKEKYVRIKKKSRLTRLMAVVLAILLVSYNLSFSAIPEAWAVNSNDVYTLKIVENGAAKENVSVTVHNANNEINVTKTTGTDGIVSFPELIGFGENKSFEFQIDGEPPFTRDLTDGTVEHLVYEITTDQVTLEPPPAPQPQPQLYTVSAVIINGTGTIKLDNKDYTQSVDVQFEEGSTVPVEIVPGENFAIKSVKINGQEQAVTDNTRYIGSIESISADTKIEAEFVKTYKITISSNGNGELRDNAGQIIASAGGTVTVEQGQDSSFTFVPAENYHVQELKIDEVPFGKLDSLKDGAGYKYTFQKVGSNHKAEVTFAIDTYQVKAEVVGGNGSVMLDKYEVEHGGDVKVTMVPKNTAYKVSELLVNGEVVALSDTDNNLDDGSYTYTVKGITKNTDITVKFAEVVALEGSWENYVSLTPESGSLVKSFKSGDNDVLVYSKDAVVSINPIDPYTKLDVSSKYEVFKHWRDEITINDSITIDGLIVKEKGFKWGKEVPMTGKILLVFDTESPLLEELYLKGPNEAFTGDSVWYSGTVSVTGKIGNPGQSFDGVSYSTDIDKVYYSKEPHLAGDRLEASYNPVDGTYTFGTVDEDYKGIYRIWAVDKAGNESIVKDVAVNIDKTNPLLADGKDAVNFIQKKEGFFAKALHFLSFGTFFNDEIEITVKVQDDASGVQSISLSTDDNEVVPDYVEGSFKSDGLTAEAKFTLNADSFKGSFNVEVTDKVKNKSLNPVTRDNSNIESEESGIIMIEKKAPTAKIAIKPKDDVSSNGENVFNGDVAYEVEAGDAESGVNTVIIDVNGKKFEHDYSKGSKQETGPLRYTISTDDPEVKINEDGSYKFSVYVIDNAGNTVLQEKTIYKDESSPRMVDYSFSVENGNGNYEKVEETDQLKEAVELTSYGFYFKKPTTVTVKAEDPKVKNEYSSQVKSVVVYLKDQDSGKYFAVQENGSLREIGVNAIDSLAPIATAGELAFNLPAAFKGQIFSKATDNVNNTGPFETPDGTVIENPTKHQQESHITLEKPKAAFKDNENRELYAGDVPVRLIVADTYSGLSEIEWSVVSPHDTANNQGGRITIKNDKSYGEGSEISGWRQIRTDRNLVQEMEKTINVRNNSNNIIVKVKITDRAGNTSEEKLEFSIDKSAPLIKVSFDNNTPDPGFPDFYKSDRTATIVITERNFKKEDVEYLITNTDGVIPKLAGWTTQVNKADPDKTTHTATVRYTADGDYTFDIKYKDSAGNKAPAVAQSKFTLDKTVPKVNVSYSNNANANGNYYKLARTAHISITEHNFDPSRIRITGTAMDNGKKSAFPAISGWSSHGDVHTAAISYASDGKYSFDIDFTDKAGNVMADYKADEFIIDQTAPELKITGVKDKSANKGDVIPVIAFSDTNFNKQSVSIKLAGANRKAVALDGKYANVPNGQVFTFNNFAKKKEIDDLYTLTVSLTDFAGNVSTQTVHFSVNRFGSVYAFDGSLDKIKGKYVKEEQDIILTETNVDSLKGETIKVKMTKNGTPADLVNGTDYTVTETGGKGQWSQYKYVINKSLFAADGKYTVALYSEDAAGNINENIDETKKAEISFGIDKTAPVIVPIDIESGEQYPVDTKPVSVSIKDNLVLQNAVIYLNGKKVEHKANGENFTFEIPNSNKKQNVKIVAVDAAGNELSKEVKDILVSTNPIVRWYNDTPVFLGSLGGVGGLAIALAASIWWRKRKLPVVTEDTFDKKIG